MKQKTLRFWGWGIPIFCICVAGFVVYLQTQALQEAHAKRNGAEKAVAIALANQLETERHPALVKYAAVAQIQGEEPDFLGYLRQKSDEAGVVIVSWNSSLSTYANQNDPNADLTKGITKINSILELSGTYPALRKFIETLTSAERLFTMSNINWTISKSGELSMTCTLSRYVEQPGDTTTPTTTQNSPGQNSPGQNSPSQNAPGAAPTGQNTSASAPPHS